MSDAVAVYDQLISSHPDDFRGYLAKVNHIPSFLISFNLLNDPHLTRPHCSAFFTTLWHKYCYADTIFFDEENMNSDVIVYDLYFHLSR